MKFRALHRASAVAVVVAMLGQAGCYHAVVRGGPRSAMRPETRTAWNLFWGIADATFDLPDCPNGVAQMELWDPWWGIFPSLLTLGIASPKRLRYVCAAGEQALSTLGLPSSTRATRRHPAPPVVQPDEEDDDAPRVVRRRPAPVRVVQADDADGEDDIQPTAQVRRARR